MEREIERWQTTEKEREKERQNEREKERENHKKISSTVKRIMGQRIQTIHFTFVCDMTPSYVT